MTHPIPDPRTLTLNSSGNGTVTFRGAHPTMWRQFTKITIEVSTTGSGTVSIFYRGQLMTSKAIALMMTAVGALSLGASEQIDIQFLGGAPNSQVKVTGHYADLPELGPEQGFSWSTSVGFSEPLDNPVLIESETSLLLNNFFFYESDIMDVRAYNSHGLFLDLFGGTWTNSAEIELRIIFYADAAGTTEIFRESYLVYSRSAPGSSEIKLTDQMHGPYMQITLEDYQSLGASINLTYRLFGSYRPLGNAYLRSSDDGVLYDVVRVNLGVGANDGGQAANLAYGRAIVSMVATVVPVTLEIRLGGAVFAANTRYTLTATVANTRVDKEIILPRQQPWVVITNNGAAVSTIRANIFQLTEPS